MSSGSSHLRVDVANGDLKAHGLFTEGHKDLRSSKPLLVLIHGTGVNARYFDNDFHSVPKDLSAEGFDVLNIHRVGYGGNPIPATKTPVLESIQLYTNLIRKAYEENSSGKNGIILVGHSLGGAVVLSIAASGAANLPILGVSSLGCIPNKEHSPILLAAIQANPEEPRFITEPTQEAIENFMGPEHVFNQEILLHPSIPTIFEPGLKSELLECFDSTWYENFVNHVAPNVKVPLQFLAGEYELVWKGVEQGLPIFNEAAALFVNAPSVDSGILPGGAHNFEFSKNSAILHKRRLDFIHGLVGTEKTSTFDRIPLLDFALSQDPATKPQFLESLQNAIVNVGFLFVKNTTVASTVQEHLIKKGIELFDLPLEEKMRIEMANSKHFLGYAKLGAEITAKKSDYREQFDFATEVPPPGPEEPLYRNLRGPNQWPDESVIPGFRAAVESYISEITTLSESFNGLIAEALGLEPNAFDKFFDVPQQNKLKLVKYPAPPPSENSASDTEVQGVGPHRDGSFLTFLLQATSHAGLEVQNKNGEWIKASPIPGTLVINIGRSLEALTGGICTATTHRVNLSPANFLSADGKSLGPRYSFPVFQGVKIDLEAKDIDLKIPQHIKDLVKDEKVRTDAEETFNSMFRENVGEGVLISRITSHQDVGAKWYPDLLAQALKAQEAA